MPVAQPSTLRVPYTDFSVQFEAQRDEILGALTGVLRRGDFILGRDVEQFEQEFAALCGVKHAIGVASGTDALVLGLKSLGIGPGDEVITPPNSWISSTSSIALSGARPVFADVTDDFTIDPADIERKITPRTKAIMPVHLTGRCAPMDAILAIARRRGLAVIEDAAQAAGARFNDTPAGSFGAIACFSLHPLKTLGGLGDGGLIVTNDDEAARRLRLLRNHGLQSRDEIITWGFNSRLDTLQAAVLRLRLKRLREAVEARRRHAARYRSLISSAVTCPRDDRSGEYSAYHLFMIQCDARDALQKFLAGRGIDTKIHYPTPIHLQPCSASLGGRPGDHPVAEAQAQRILSLPIHEYLSDEQIDYAAQMMLEFYQERRA